MRFASFFSGFLALSAFALPLVSAAPINVQDFDFADAHGVETRDLVTRVAKEEFWFRFESTPPTSSADFLHLAERNGEKDFDDQAYKFISSDIAKVTRKIPRRTGVKYVLPKGTRDQVLKAAKKFEDTSVAGEAANFVTKDNEPGDIGIQGIKADPKTGKTPLDVFRSKVIRAVYSTGASSAPFITVPKSGKASRTATEADRKALASIG